MRSPFRLKRPQPSFLALLASGWSPVYPCHVLPRDMRSHPVGTGPFKFVEFRPNERIRVARNPEYWKSDRPYLDGIEWRIVPSLATRILGFVAGSFDQLFGVTFPLLQDLKSQAPQAVCDVFPANLPRTLLKQSHHPLRSTTPSCGGRWRSAWIIKPLSTSSPWDRAMLAARCSRCRRGCGGCRWRCSEPCPATIPTWRKTARRPEASWRSSA